MPKANAFESTNISMPMIIDESPEIAEMKHQVELMNKGFIVHIANVEKSKDEYNYLVLKVTLLSEVNRMPVFGNVEFKITKQALPRLKSELAKLG